MELVAPVGLEGPMSNRFESARCLAKQQLEAYVHGMNEPPHGKENRPVVDSSFYEPDGPWKADRPANNGPTLATRPLPPSAGPALIM